MKYYMRVCVCTRARVQSNRYSNVNNDIIKNIHEMNRHSVVHNESGVVLSACTVAVI